MVGNDLTRKQNQNNTIRTKGTIMTHSTHKSILNTLATCCLTVLLAGSVRAGEPPKQHPMTGQPGWTIYRDIYKERAEAREEAKRKALEPVVLTPEQKELDRKVLEEIVEEAKHSTPNPIFIQEQAHRALEILAEADPNLVPSMGPGGELWEAIERYRQTGEAVIIKESGAVTFPFGESQPVVRCSTLRACDIELQPGEVISGVALGDSHRWIVSPLESGDPQRPTPHVIVKPTRYDMATNIIIATDRRTYHLGLVSPPLDAVEKGELDYHRHVTFYYPAEMVEQWANAEQLAARRARDAARQHQRSEQQHLARLTSEGLDGLRFDYDVRTRKRGGFFRRLFQRRKPAHFEPVAVFDDGRQVFIRLSERARDGDLPVLLVTGPGGEPTVVNYRVVDDWFIVDGVFEEAELVLGVGKHREAVSIERIDGRRA